jgi:hypothetical protein
MKLLELVLIVILSVLLFLFVQYIVGTSTGWRDGHGVTSLVLLYVAYAVFIVSLFYTRFVDRKTEREVDKRFERFADTDMVSICRDMAVGGKITEKAEQVRAISWDEFRAIGALWFVNRILHLLGLAIVVQYDKNGKLESVYPARVRFRGFNEHSEATGFIRLSEYLQKNVDDLVAEARE